LQIHLLSECLIDVERIAVEDSSACSDFYGHKFANKNAQKNFFKKFLFSLAD
jgi:hypothetical protein